MSDCLIWLRVGKPLDASGGVQCCKTWVGSRGLLGLRKLLRHREPKLACSMPLVAGMAGRRVLHVMDAGSDHIGGAAGVGHSAGMV